MRISDALVEELLLQGSKTTAAQLDALKKQEKIERKPLQDLAVENKLITKQQLTNLYSIKIGTEFIDLSEIEIKNEVLRLLPERTARQYHAVVFRLDEKGIKHLAMEEPDKAQAVGFLKKQLGKDLKIYLGEHSEIQKAIERYGGSLRSHLRNIAQEDSASSSRSTSSEQVSDDSPIAQTLNLIIESAIKANASDIHIEPRENFVLVRHRVDGILSEANKLPSNVLDKLASRVKLLANLKADEHRAPQDGRFKIGVKGSTYSLRVSTLPIVDGEKLALHISNESSKPASLSELGFWGKSLRLVNGAITQPHGLVLVSGPTGSGRSTTLFSMISSLVKPGSNVATIEDPIEYRIKGANQTQVNMSSGMNFSGGLKALLKQDPNIIMVGELQDGPTAKLAVQAAHEGHLIFSSLSTKSAVADIPHLINIGVEPHQIASAFRVIVNQRLVKRLCEDCRESYKPGPAELSKISKVVVPAQATNKSINELESLAREAGIGDNLESGSTPTNIVKLWRASSEGCEGCNFLGYKGRLGINEVLGSSAEIIKLITGGGSSEKIKLQALKDGMITMKLDGIIKALRAQTTIDEVLGVS